MTAYLKADLVLWADRARAAEKKTYDDREQKFKDDADMLVATWRASHAKPLADALTELAKRARSKTGKPVTADDLENLKWRRYYSNDAAMNPDGSPRTVRFPDNRASGQPFKHRFDPDIAVLNRLATITEGDTLTPTDLGRAKLRPEFLHWVLTNGAQKDAATVEKAVAVQTVESRVQNVVTARRARKPRPPRKV